MKTARSMWFWAGLMSASGLAILLAPQLLAGALGVSGALPASTRALGRLFGIVLVAYGAGYAVSAASDGRAFMRASVVLRASAFPLVSTLVAIGWLPVPLLALGVVDLAGAMWTRHELRRSGRDGAAFPLSTSRSRT